MNISITFHNLLCLSGIVRSTAGAERWLRLKWLIDLTDNVLRILWSQTLWTINIKQNKIKSANELSYISRPRSKLFLIYEQLIYVKKIFDDPIGAVVKLLASASQVRVQFPPGLIWVFVRVKFTYVKCLRSTRYFY